MSQLKFLLIVFLGGGAGSMLRFLLGKWMNGIYTLPLGTLIANVAACFILGLFVSLADHKLLLNPNLRLFLTVGFCGGFSTFSSFSQETFVLLTGNNGLMAALYIILSIVLCLLATFAGFALVKTAF